MHGFSCAFGASWLLVLPLSAIAAGVEEGSLPPDAPPMVDEIPAPVEKPPGLDAKPAEVPPAAETKPELEPIPAVEEKPAAVDPDIAAALMSDLPKQREARKPLTFSGLAGQEKTPLQSLNPDISVILDLGLGAFSTDDHIRQGGHGIDENGFKIQSLEFVLGGSVDPYFRFDMNFQFASLEMEEAYLSTLSLPVGMQVRAGKFISRFGRQNARHLHAWSFVNP